MDTFTRLGVETHRLVVLLALVLTAALIVAGTPVTFSA